MPIDDLHEEFFKLVQVLKRHTAHAGDVVVREEDVVVELGRDVHRSQNEPAQTKKLALIEIQTLGLTLKF